MYITSAEIEKYRILEGVKLQFQTPKDAGADSKTHNVINVIAGVNGCGKTSLLDAIFQSIQAAKNHWEVKDLNLSINLSFENQSNVTLIHTTSKEAEKQNKRYPSWHEFNKLLTDCAPSTHRIIYTPTLHIADYKTVSQLTNNKEFAYKVDQRMVLGNAETYIKDFVIAHERASTEADPKARTQQAIDAFNRGFLDAQLLTKLHNLSTEQFNRPVFKNISGELVTIDQLSDGEKQLYGRVIALMILNPQDSIILIDEPELSLHPTWQQKIMQIYAHIGRNNQYIVATHSPQIVASVPYQNVILLRKNNDSRKIEAVHLSEPPTGLDVNSILSEIMGTEAQPKKLIALYEQYRSFIDNQTENTDDARAIKTQLLALEGSDSAFMQEMQFLIDLRGE